jgi:hypothetical protein
MDILVLGLLSIASFILSPDPLSFGMTLAFAGLIVVELRYNYQREQKWKKSHENVDGSASIQRPSTLPTRWWYFWETI